MSQRVEVSNIGLVNEYYQGLLPTTFYAIDRSQDLIIEGCSSKDFITSRTALLDEFINIDKSKHHEMSQAYLAEQLVRIAIKNPLEERGFFMNIAPQNIEHGNNQKGVDLLVIDSDKMISLGIDLKLRKRRARSLHDGFGWCQNTLSPFIYLKMGNWSLETREESGVDIRHWIKEYANPKLKTTGKLPRVYELRQYIIPRISEAIKSYIEVIDDSEGKYKLYRNCIPEDRQSYSLLKRKLVALDILFSSISKDYHLEGQRLH